MNKLITITLCLFLSVSIYSQTEREYTVQTEKMENIKAKKIAFITDELSLTPEQAEKFWPLYNEHFSNSKDGKREHRKDSMSRGERNESSAEDLNAMSEEQAAARLSEIFKKEEEKLQAKKDFVEKLKSVLDTKQILRLFRAEKKFKRNIFRDYKKKVRVIELK